MTKAFKADNIQKACQEQNFKLLSEYTGARQPVTIQCHCGEIFTTIARNILEDRCAGCEKCRKEHWTKSRMRDIANMRFGKLVAIRHTKSRHCSNVKWLCECDCGNTCTVSLRSLLSGSTKACGCLRKKNIKGKRFGRLVAEYPTEKRNSDECVVWSCLCDCGNRHEAASRELLRGTTKSCGCITTDKRKNYILPSVSPSQLCSIKHRAMRDNLDFTITKEYIDEVFKQQKGLCALSGVEICFAKHSQHSRGKTTASLDRIDSSKGYIEGNVQWVHKAINRLKGSLPDAELLDWVKKIYIHRIKE